MKLHLGAEKIGTLEAHKNFRIAAQSQPAIDVDAAFRAGGQVYG